MVQRRNITVGEEVWYKKKLEDDSWKRGKVVNSRRNRPYEAENEQAKFLCQYLITFSTSEDWAQRCHLQAPMGSKSKVINVQRVILRITASLKCVIECGLNLDRLVIILSADYNDEVMSATAVMTRRASRYVNQLICTQCDLDGARPARSFTGNFAQAQFSQSLHAPLTLH
ncbi:hypothetical protein J6590_029404 [Homalodisca vitripennis]|nr:hypothetical protein J6590_029404 [Homalodisca vitripennis]